MTIFDDLEAEHDALDQLIDDRLVFTGPDGVRYSKQDDLDLQRSGEQRLTEVTEEELTAPTSAPREPRNSSVVRSKIVVAERNHKVLVARTRRRADHNTRIIGGVDAIAPLRHQT